MIVCVNKSSKEFKDLLKETRMHPIVLAAKINEWQDLNKTDRFPTKEQVVLGKNITKENVPLHDLDGQTRLLYSLNAPETQNKSIIDTQYEKVLRDRIDEFLSKMGFKIDSRGSFTDINGNPIDARAMVDFLNKIVSIAEGNSDISDLTEETIHIVVRLLQQSNDPLYKAMLDQIESMSEYAETLQNYSNVAGYDDAKLHEEAIGKAIKNIIINRKHEEENALPVYKSWFQKLVDWFKSLGKKIKDDPFIRTAQMFMNDEFAKYTEATGTDKMYAKIPQTQEDAVKLFDHTNNTLVKKIVNVKDFVSKGYKGVRDELERYYDTVNGVIVPNRITDKPQEIRDAKKSKSRIIKEQDSPSALLFKKLGTRLHATMELLGPAVLNNTSLEGAQTQSQLNSRDFAKLVKFTKSMISEAETIQNRIDPKGKIAWRFEQKIYSLAENEGGTIDVMAVYSNGTSASTWEYKFKHTSGYNSTIDQLTRQRVFTRDVMDDEAIYAGDIQMSRQKNILAQNYGITDLRTSRLVPFAITVPYKEGVPEDKITELFSPIDGSEYLTVLALGDESTGIEALDNKLKVIDKRIINLKAALIDAVLPVHKEKLRSMIHDLRKVQLKIHTEYDISLILDLAYSAAKPALGTTEKKFEDGKLLHSNEEYINGKPNPQYMSLKELQDLMDELTAYSSILEESAIYAVAVGDKELLSPDRIANIKRRTSITKDLVDNTIGFIKVKMEERLFGDANSQGIDLNPKTRPVRQLTWAQLNLNRLSEIDHPVFEYARSLLFKADGAKRAQVLQTAKEIEELEKELFAYADSIGVSHMKIYDKYIEKDGFYIKSMYKDELYQDLLPKHRLANNAAWIKERFDVREDYMNKYNDKFDSQKKKIWDMWRDVETQPDVWTRNGDIRTKLLEQWVDRNDYRKNGFWLDSDHQKHLIIKDQYKDVYISDDYREISSVPALKAFYDYMMEKNKEFAEIVGPGKISADFLPKVRKTLMDEVVQYSGGIFAKFAEARRLFVDSHRFRQDGIMGQHDPDTGEPKPKIPLLYTNPFRDRFGEIRMEQNSRDLGTNLFLFAEQVYNYEQKTAIEPVISALEDLLRMNRYGDVKMSETNAPKKDVKGNFIRDIRNSNTLNVFQRLMKYYMYGQKIQNDKVFKMFGIDFSRNSLVRSIMKFHRMKTLGFAIIPPIAARMAGEGAMYFEGMKGKFYDPHHILEAHKMFWENRKEFTMANRFFNVYQEEASFKLAHGLSANVLSKRITMDNLVRGYSLADEKIDNIILVSMMLSHGFNDQGNIYKLTKEDVASGKKNLVQLISVKDNKMDITGLTETSFQQFRQTVRNVAGSIKGAMTAEDIMAINTYLIGQMAMMYRNWMPGVVKERFGAFRFNPLTKTFEEGRYRVMFTNIFNEQTTLMSAVGDIFKTGLRMLGVMDNFKNYKLGKPGTASYDRAKRFVENEYAKFKLQYEGDVRFGDNFSLDNFIDMRVGQTRAWIAEMRGMILILAMMVGGKMDWDKDGEPEWKDIWLTRKLFQVLNRAQSEWSFVWDPTEWKNFFSSPFALSGLMSDGINVVMNTFDVTRDWWFGQNANNDRTPWFYYSSKLFLPGMRNIQGLTEWFKQDQLRTR